MKLAGHAFAIRPKDRAVQDALFDLQVRAGDWAGARETLRAKARSGALPRDVAARREAVLDHEIARAAEAAGERAAALAAADAAVKGAPGLAPAAALAARLHAVAGETKKAGAILRDAWRIAPHPDLAQAFAALAPNESPGERRRRFRDLLAASEADAESRLTAAELAIADSDWLGAARALGDLAATQPTHRALAIMAAAEKGQGAPEPVVRGYLARAITAPRGRHWTCEACGAAPGAWSAVCSACGGFDTLAWREDAGGAEPLAASMLPLIVESGEAKAEADLLDADAAAEAVREAQPAR
jgi:HemY protein